MKPRIGVNLLYAVPGKVGGSEDYSIRLLAAIADHPDYDYDLMLFARTSLAQAHPQLFERFESATIDLPANRVLRVGAEHSWLGRESRRRGVAAMHHLGGTVPRRGLPAMLTVHDLQPLDMPQNFSRPKRTYLSRALPASVRRARCVVGVSEWVRQALIDRFALDPANVFAVTAPADPALDRQVATSRAALDALPADLRSLVDNKEPYVLYPAISYVHKNHTTLLKAAARTESLTVVLCGSAGPLDGAIDAESASLGVASRVRRLGRIPRAQLDTLMAHATALAWPSLYEGFGLPIVEAMQLGCPVIAADTTALPEAVGGAGRLVPATDVDAWSEALAAVARWSAAELADYRMRAAARVADFAPARVAPRWHAAHKRLLEIIDS